MKYSKVIFYIIKFAVISTVTLYASKGEGVSGFGILSSMKIDMELNTGYSDWGTSIDQNRFAILVWVSNNNQTVAIENVEISATLNSIPLEVRLNSPSWGDSDTNNDNLVDEIQPGELKRILLLSEPLSVILRDAHLEIKIKQYNEVESNLELNDNVSILFSKNGTRPFTFGKDQFNFPNWEMTPGEFLGHISSNDMVGMLLHAKHSFMGNCFGMAGAAGRYFVSPASKPYSDSDPFTWENNSELKDEIAAYQIAQIFPNISYAFSDINQTEEMEKLEGYLENFEPAVLSMKKIGENTGHAILATKITILEDAGTSVINCYNSQDKNYSNEVYATYNYSDQLFDFESEYDKIRVVEIPSATQIAGTGALSLFANKVRDLLYDNGQKVFITSSPVNMSVENSYGQKTGLLEDGTHVNDIPGAELYRIPKDESLQDSLTIVYVPQEDLYYVKIRGAGEGFMRFEIYVPRENGGLMFSYVDSLVVTDLLTVTYSEENPSGGIEVDNDGDGFADYIITPIIQDIPTNIESKYASTIFTGYELYQNYPNPFNPTTTIIFDIPVTSQATIKVYDIQGGFIKTLVNTYYSVGSHRVVWDGTNSSGMKINSGVYFYVLNTGETRIVKKMQLLK